MVAEHRSDDALDPDEDLFDFEETLLASTLDEDLDDDLEELLATLQPAPAAPPPRRGHERRVPGPAADALGDLWGLPEDALEPARTAPGPGSGTGLVPAWSLPTSILVLFVAMTCVNGLVAFLSLRTTADLHNRTLANDLLIASVATGLSPVDPSHGFADETPDHRAALARMTQAEIAELRGQVETARDHYLALAEEHPGSPLVGEALLRAGRLSARMERWNDAARTFRTLLERDVAPELHAPARLEWARALVAQGDADAALAVLNEPEAGQR